MNRITRRLRHLARKVLKVHRYPHGWHPVLRDGLITKHAPPYIRDREFLAAVDHVRKLACFGAQPEYPVYRLHILWKTVRLCRSVPGDVVEFGTFRGGTATIIARSMHAAGISKRLYLYSVLSSESHLIGRYHGTSIDQVRSVLAPHTAEFRLGWIPDSLKDDGPDAISFMHVDLNAAEPTRAALEWSFPRWSRSGVCILDDYLWSGYEDQRLTVEQFFSGKGLEIVGLPTGQGLVLNQ